MDSDIVRQASFMTGIPASDIQMYKKKYGGFDRTFWHDNKMYMGFIAITLTIGAGSIAFYVYKKRKSPVASQENGQ